MNKIDFTVKAFCSATFYRLPRALLLFLNKKKQKSRAAEKKAKKYSSGVK